MISKFFFLVGVLAYAAFAADRAQAFGVHDYSTDVIAVILLAILGHFAFGQRAREA